MSAEIAFTARLDVPPAPVPPPSECQHSSPPSEPREPRETNRLEGYEGLRDRKSVYSLNRRRQPAGKLTSHTVDNGVFRVCEGRASTEEISPVEPLEPETLKLGFGKRRGLEKTDTVERVRVLELMKVVGVSSIVKAAEEDVVGGLEAKGEVSCSRASAARVSKGEERRNTRKVHP